MSDVDRVSPVPPRPPSTGPDQRKPAQRCRPVSPVPTPRDATRLQRHCCIERSTHPARSTRSPRSHARGLQMSGLWGFSGCLRGRLPLVGAWRGRSSSQCNSAIATATGQRDGHRVAGGPLHQGRHRGLAGLSDHQSGSPDASLRRGPLRTARAAFTASSSSKPWWRFRTEGLCRRVGERGARIGSWCARGGCGHRPVSRVARDG
jgi:hypothetical protein